MVVWVDCPSKKRRMIESSTCMQEFVLTVYLICIKNSRFLHRVQGTWKLASFFYQFWNSYNSQRSLLNCEHCYVCRWFAFIPLVNLDITLLQGYICRPRDRISTTILQAFNQTCDNRVNFQFPDSWKIWYNCHLAPSASEVSRSKKKPYYLCAITIGFTPAIIKYWWYQLQHADYYSINKLYYTCMHEQEVT